MRLPKLLDEGKYRIVAEAKLKDATFEKNFENNTVRSPFQLAYSAIPEELETVDVAEELVEKDPSNLFMHVAAVSLATGAFWQSQVENQKYQDALDRRSELNQSYQSSSSSSELAVISSELQNNQNQMEVYAQNANRWDVLALIGIGWEIYNIFFWSPEEPVFEEDEVMGTEPSKPLIKGNTWMHISAISMALGSAWMSNEEQTQYSDLIKENNELRGQYASSSDAYQVIIIKNKIESNKKAMETHIYNANLMDGMMIAALGWESYLLWRLYTEPEKGSSYKRKGKTKRMAWQPYINRDRFGIALHLSW